MEDERRERQTVGPLVGSGGWRRTRPCRWWVLCHVETCIWWMLISWDAKAGEEKKQTRRVYPFVCRPVPKAINNVSLRSSFKTVIVILQITPVLWPEGFITETWWQRVHSLKKKQGSILVWVKWFPWKGCVEIFKPPAPINVTLFGNKIFADVMLLGWDHRGGLQIQ